MPRSNRKNLNRWQQHMKGTAKEKMNALIASIFAHFEMASAYTTEAVVNFNNTAFYVLNTTSTSLKEFNWRPFLEVLDKNWARLANDRPILLLYPLAILTWIFIIQLYARRNKNVDMYDLDEKHINAFMTIYSFERGVPSYMMKGQYGTHPMVRRSMRPRYFYELA